MSAIFNTIFIICLALAIVFFIVSVILFFLFDIRGIFNIKTGRAEKKRIKELEEANAKTGRLRGAKAGVITEKGEPKAQNAVQAPPAPQVKETPRQKKAEKPRQDDADKTSLLDNPQQNDTEATSLLDNTEQTDTDATSLLDQADQSDEEQTALLSSSEQDEAGETTLFAEPADTGETTLLSPAQSESRFKIIKKVILCDTNEIIA